MMSPRPDRSGVRRAVIENVRKRVNQQCLNVLFLSSGNSTRSIMAEAILQRIGGGRFCAYSAGSHPTGRVNPLALEQLKQRGYAIEGLASKSWSRFTRADSPPLHLLIGVCSKVVGERHPAWPGSPMELVWDLRSPGMVQGSDAEVRAVFASVCSQLEAAMHELIAVRFDQLDAATAHDRLRRIEPRALCSN
jgi:arsenate reductase